MRKMLISMAAVAVALGAAPASAQYGRGGNDYDRLANRVERAYDRGAIPRQSYHILMRDIDRTANLERTYMRDGRVTRHEARTLDQRLASIQNRLRGARRL